MIYINGRFLTQNITGVQRFSQEITDRLSKLIDVAFLVPDLNSVRVENKNKGLNLIEVKGLSGHLWEQITLPLYLKKNGSPLLVNLCNTAPIRYKNQIITHHDVTYVRYPKSYPLLFRVLYKFIASSIIKNSKAILTVSEFSKQEISSYYKCNKSKINVVYNAVNNMFKPTDSVGKEEYILAVSSPNYHKNFHGLIEAFSSTKLDVKLNIIGSATKVFSQVEMKMDDERVNFLGRVDDLTLIKLYQNAKLFVFPSFYEGFGIPPLEAQACGCPVISSDRASMKEVLGSSVMFFNPDSKMEMIKSIESVLYDSTVYESLRARGFENVNRYSWQTSAEKVLEVINKVND